MDPSSAHADTGTLPLCLEQYTASQFSFAAAPKPFKNPHFTRHSAPGGPGKRNKTLKQILTLERERVDDEARRRREKREERRRRREEQGDDKTMDEDAEDEEREDEIVSCASCVRSPSPVLRALFRGLLAAVGRRYRAHGTDTFSPGSRLDRGAPFAHAAEAVLRHHRSRGAFRDVSSRASDQAPSASASIAAFRRRWFADSRSTSPQAKYVDPRTLLRYHSPSIYELIRSPSFQPAVVQAYLALRGMGVVLR
jgi:INO80 complex subunit C